MQHNNVSSIVPEPQSFGFLLLPEYSMIAVSSAIEPLRMANYITQKQLYQWNTITIDDKPVAASNGIMSSPTASVESAGNMNVVFVCGGINIKKHGADALTVRWIQDLSRKKKNLGGLCTGTYTLAKANLLDKVRCTVHWEVLDAVREEFPHLHLTHQLFEIDGGRYTCAGGQAPLDMMLGLIQQEWGGTLAADISDEFLYDRIRESRETQSRCVRNLVGPGGHKLASVIALMTANIENPVGLSALAKHAHLSRRQLQRLFRTHLHTSPSRFYINMRLERARQLLHLTGKSILEVGLASGFRSAPHFTKCYRENFGITPREDRNRGR